MHCRNSDETGLWVFGAAALFLGALRRRAVYLATGLGLTQGLGFGVVPRLQVRGSRCAQAKHKSQPPTLTPRDMDDAQSMIVCVVRPPLYSICFPSSNQIRVGNLSICRARQQQNKYLQPLSRSPAQEMYVRPQTKGRAGVMLSHGGKELSKHTCRS